MRRRRAGAPRARGKAAQGPADSSNRRRALPTGAANSLFRWIGKDMRATCWYGPNNMVVEDVPDPKIVNKQDAIVRITSTAICGSDLHLYNGFIPFMEPGDILGHEFMGEVVEVGSEVKKLKVGDRVV